MFFFKNSATENYEKKIYDFSIESITGETINFKDYKNKVILVVNTASYCGFTKQYDELQELWDLYKEKGLIVIGVPLLCYDTYNILSSATKNKGMATAISMLNIIWPLALMILIFYIYRIMYSMCRGSLKKQVDEAEEMMEGPMGPVVDQPMESAM